ncbi:MAG: energy transducer TonB, partial [Betaproteobacteria bacterium]
QPVEEHAVQQAPVEAAPPSPPAPAPVQPVAEPAIEPPRYNAAYLSNPPPAYPLAARRRSIEGTVLVRAEISTGGECLRAELKKTSGAAMLDQAALEAVKKWRFVPAKRGSQAVVAWVEVPIAFKLENN